jgi:hypothetical protein
LPALWSFNRRRPTAEFRQDCRRTMTHLPKENQTAGIIIACILVRDTLSKTER